jgi:hypothetical protein
MKYLVNLFRRPSFSCSLLILLCPLHSWKIPYKGLELVKQRVSLTSVVSKFREVNEVNGLCLCPFHQDESPSMKVNEIPGYYYCFSCGSSGNVVSFLSHMLKIPYSDVLKKCLRAIEEEKDINDFLPTGSATPSTAFKKLPVGKTRILRGMSSQGDEESLPDASTDSPKDLKSSSRDEFLRILKLSNDYYQTRLQQVRGCILEYSGYLIIEFYFATFRIPTLLLPEIILNPEALVHLPLMLLV